MKRHGNLWDKNTPIGNYTSQWFGNLYMNELDQVMKHEHKTRAYIRYCDDFVIFDNCKKKLQDLQNWICTFIKDKLMLKFSKASVFPVTQEVDFLGYRHFPQKILLRKETAKRVTRRLRSLPFLLQVGKITIEQYRSSIASTEGWLKWASTYNLRLKLNLISLKGALA
jgi:RNA-directed DNA polymerase